MGIKKLEDGGVGEGIKKSGRQSGMYGRHLTPLYSVIKAIRFQMYEGKIVLNKKELDILLVLQILAIFYPMSKVTLSWKHTLKYSFLQEKMTMNHEKLWSSFLFGLEIDF